MHQLVQWQCIMHKHLWTQSAVRGNVPSSALGRTVPLPWCHQPRDSLNVSGLFFQLESMAYSYTQTCADKCSLHYSFSLRSMGSSPRQKGYKASHYIFILNLLYFGFESKATFLSSREHTYDAISFNGPNWSIQALSRIL